MSHLPGTLVVMSPTVMRPIAVEHVVRTTRARAELLIRNPPTLGAFGRVRDAVLEARAEAEESLADADRRLRDAVRDRQAAIDRITDCNRALLGSGQVRDDVTGELRQWRPRRRAAPDDPLPETPAVDVSTPRVLSGRALREVLLELMTAIGGPVGVDELHRLLRLHGFTTTGRASRTISNALVTEVKRGTVVRVDRGRYAIRPIERL